MKHIVCAIVGLALVGVISGQESSIKKESLAKVSLRDGSEVFVALPPGNLAVVTKYGQLTIPFTEVRKIEFGIHYPDGLEKSLEDAIGRLGSNVYREREDAAKYLANAGHYAYFVIKKMVKDGDDLEKINRRDAILKRIQEKVAPELLSIKEHDVVQAVEFTAVGRIQGFDMKAHSPHLGDLTLKLSSLNAMRIGAGGGEHRVEIDSARYGDQWLDTSTVVTPDDRIVIVAEGNVDLWPQGPGQYCATPNGYSTPGKGGVFRAGALLGRVGEQGKVFLIGERHEGVPSEEGKLFLSVVPSPWNNASAGIYRVRVVASPKAGR